MECVYDVVRVRPGENVDFQRAVRGVHVIVPHEHRGKALQALRSMWSQGKKRNFPLKCKYTVVPNGGDPSMMVGSAARANLAALWKLQGRLLKNTMEKTLDGVIKDPSLPMYGGGPSLSDHPVGMQHPHENKPIFNPLMNQ